MVLKNDVADDVPWCLTEEHREWRQTVQRFAQDVLQPAVTTRDLQGQFDDGIAARMGALGVYGMLIPEEYGGMGGDMTSACVAIEELARVDSSAAVTAHVQAMVGALIARLGNDSQKQQLLPEMATGAAFVSLGLTEPSGGSDAGAITTRATREGGEWVLSGSKQFITNSGTARSTYTVVVAATGTGRSASLFLVPHDAPGFSVGAAYPKMGWRSSDTHPLFFDSVRLPDSALIGDVDSGYREALAFLTAARIPIAAMGTGLAQGCLDATREFVRDRKSFTKPLAEHQAVAFGVADLAAMTHTARVVTFDAAWKYDNAHDFVQAAALCKLVATELANRVAYKATQLHGGYGFVDEYDVSRHYRDARVLTIGEGTSEVQRLLIARSLGLPV